MNTARLLNWGQRTYRKYFAAFFVFRLLREGVLVVLRLRQRWLSLRRPMLGSNEFKLVAGTVFQQLFGPKTVSVEQMEWLVTHAPMVDDAAGEKEVRFLSPRIDLVELKNATAIGGTNFILSGRYAIHPDLYQPSRDSSPAEAYGTAAIDRHLNNVKFFLNKPRLSVDRAVSLLNQSANNYAHWVTEVLPKLPILDAHSDYDGWPLLVGGWIHPNMHESIALLGGKSREVIKVARWQPVAVEQLVDISLPAYEPYIPHKLFSVEVWSQINCFSRPALHRLREQALRVPVHEFPRRASRVYLRRSPDSYNLRQIANAADIEGLIVQYGFEIVEPGRMTFEEQLSVIRRAEVIVAPVGAALANMAFAAAGTRILALAPRYRTGNYFYYQNLAAALEHRFEYVFGEPSPSRAHPMHRTYTIEIEVLRRKLESLPVSS